MQDPNPDLAITLHENKSSPSPLKFHRIWSDSDEIQLLQGLIDSTKMGLIFPRDLGLLQFSKGSMSKSYTKNQLYEKHRRLREKFRVISERITRGLDFSLRVSSQTETTEKSDRRSNNNFISKLDQTWKEEQSDFG
ncbi:GLABROUS1 enhancer-binding protein-like 2 isoform X2 [Papaver somniferum]|uniref:GLABROUS1 enhancer-binding protein-like 2 isoform X2 n=1 Tax=Papaver somniferum TaxID=3469 RepID=UPI000E6FDC07|nr:GLABROUS1 enhancer-binding protein-like 2 isoform X2 [Papaver somniferum]